MFTTKRFNDSWVNYRLEVYRQAKAVQLLQRSCGPNVLERDFEATKPDEKWVTDVTEFKVKQQKVYLSPVIDLFTQEVVAYKVAKNVRLPLVTEMLTDVVATLGEDAKPIVHSDQGGQYRHKKYQKKLSESGLTQSMSRKINCLDNAVAENFFALLKTEMYHNQHFEDADDLIDIGECPEFCVTV
ncbi:TPA: IS3 family transposase [Photobacterium damselae]